MILKELKEATREQHARVEQSVNLLARLGSLASYSRLLELFYGLYRPLEAQLAAFPQSLVDAVRLQKHRLLSNDLEGLGYPAESIAVLPQCKRLPFLLDAPAAMGCLYVLEGATLGGQIVRREVALRLPAAARQGSHFFESYGQQVGPMWAGFCAQLTKFAEASPESQSSIVEAASETFTCFEEWVR